MARPYQDAVDQFMADYQDKFLPTVITGEGTPKSPYTNMGGPETAIPMTKDQTQLERDKLLASSIHPDTFGKVLDVMRGGQAIPTGGGFGGGGGASTIGGPTNPYNPQLNRPGLPELFKRFAAYNPEITTPEAQQLLIPAEPTPFTVGGTTSGTLDQLRAAYGANYPDPVTGIIPGGGRGGFGKTFMPTGKDVIDMENLGRKPIPTPGWDYKGELAKQGTYSFEPEADYLKRTGRTALPTPDEVARIAMNVAPAIPTGSLGWNVHLPGGGSYWETPEMNARARAGSEGGGFEMSGEIKTALQDIQKILMTPSPSQDIWSPGGNIRFPGGYGKAQKDVLANLATTLTGYQAKMAEIGTEKPYRESLAEYYRKMGGVHEKALPSEEFARYATGMHALAESERPYAFPPNSAVYQGAKLLGYVPEKPEAIHPIIRDVINKSMMTDPNTGMQTGFDIRGARQKIGFMAPWLKAQGIDIPREAYKMTRPEFMAEQKAWVSRLPKKERSKYTSQYINQLWGEYWGKD